MKSGWENRQRPVQGVRSIPSWKPSPPSVPSPPASSIPPPESRRIPTSPDNRFAAAVGSTDGSVLAWKAVPVDGSLAVEITKVAPTEP
jgi:hypothetical protein